MLFSVISRFPASTSTQVEDVGALKGLREFGNGDDLSESHETGLIIKVFDGGDLRLGSDDECCFVTRSQ